MLLKTTLCRGAVTYTVMRNEHNAFPPCNGETVVTCKQSRVLTQYKRTPHTRPHHTERSEIQGAPQQRETAAPCDYTKHHTQQLAVQCIYQASANVAISAHNTEVLTAAEWLCIITAAFLL